MHSAMLQRLGHKLECPKCRTVYLTLTTDVTPITPIHCSSCNRYLGMWAELQADFYAQGGRDGIFQVDHGQIIRKA
ncbi:transcription elongation factor Elf1 [Phyllobacterium endophyticum]|uniref:Uncharacterized protein n=1 Tax=Phyllobacterium endophyticum TaxID=1149773 RepID=A0A2P7AR64_9HYPH|nr:transcription elongation factor Elf1 [Phyllobacterium endophyticum]PSH56724.1 hypothetical protein CU100_15350 [Phyllobacterium endophyticum]TYR44292.1 hypothetical protein FY050_03865 [Phyllobacterium endophyticum]